MREEIIGNCRLILGDCLEIMPTLGKVDAVVTDPPYGIGASDYQRGGTKHGASLVECVIYEKSDWDKSTHPQAILKAIEMSGHAIIFGGNYYDLPPTSCWLIWDKKNGKNHYADCEMAWTNLDKAVRLIEWTWHGMIRKGNEARVHPTQKPLGVMKWCITHLPDTAQIILDPFMGSGTTGVACVELGRKFIGIEIDEKYFDIACERISRAERQGDLFRKPVGEQSKLFQE